MIFIGVSFKGSRVLMVVGWMVQFQVSRYNSIGPRVSKNTLRITFAKHYPKIKISSAMKRQSFEL